MQTTAGMLKLKWLSLDNRAWFAGILNVAVLGHQLWMIIVTKQVQSLSLLLFAGFIYMQLTFMQVGYRTKQPHLFWSMLLSAVISATITVLILVWR